MCRDLAEVGRYAQLDNWQFRLIKQGIPGSFTFLLPATREVPRRLKHPRRSTIGVRVPDHPVVQGLLAELDERILTVLEGESLLNDASALLIYRVAVGAVVAGSFSIQSVAPTFLLGVVGSLLENVSIMGADNLVIPVVFALVLTNI